MNVIGRETRLLPPPHALRSVRPQFEGAGSGAGFLFNVPSGSPK